MTAAAEDTPWLRLARISGDHEENKRLWNGYQKYLLRPNTHEYQRQMENPKFVDIVDLSDAEIYSIQTEIPDLPKEMVWFNMNKVRSKVPYILPNIKYKQYI